MFRVGEVDVKDLKRFDNMLIGLGEDGPKVAVRAMNRAGDMGRTQVVKALAKQTGLPQKLIRRSVKVKRSTWSEPEYQLNSAGGDVSLKYFKKRETRDGVVAKLGDARGNDWFAESFFRGGLFPGRRVDIRSMGGHVFVRADGRTDLERVTSGVFIPKEMVEGASLKAFRDTVARVLPQRLDHEFSRLLAR
ncbi:phage tail protein [Pseudooceanicola sp. HF7]|uniref:phage tail protein n=1 Tax=Pseudooceanicola sp. HF7 TaxID=2721560 RepID=UPI0014320809|nr:phage tail protein [Pseudooceanicola sp. HF7]NIZ11074.1 hypothetical protein [Pseudooceanicola sp. HF7]